MLFGPALIDRLSEFSPPAVQAAAGFALSKVAFPVVAIHDLGAMPNRRRGGLCRAPRRGQKNAKSCIVSGGFLCSLTCRD